MKKLLCATAIAVATLTAPAAASAAEFEGTVVSVNRDSRTFKLRDSERGTVTIRVTSRTRFERVSFASLRPGLKKIEATVRLPMSIEKCRSVITEICRPIWRAG